MQLAGTIARNGAKVLVVDADPQATATRWAASAADETPFLAHAIGLSAATEKLHREVKKFIENYDVIVIDCPPAADSPVPQSALIIADLAIVPILPSPIDFYWFFAMVWACQNLAAHRCMPFRIGRLLRTKASGS